MNQPHTITLYRVLRAPPERVYRAFTDAKALAKWLPPHGFTAEVFELDVRVGGRHRLAFTHLDTGASHCFGGEYLEAAPPERLRYTEVFDDPNLPGVMQVDVQLTRVACGTALRITQDGVPAVISSADCHVGWQQSLALLALLVEG